MAIQKGAYAYLYLFIVVSNEKSYVLEFVSLKIKI